MNRFYLHFFFLICAFFVITQKSYAEIKMPNYDFTLSTIESFFPGKLLSDLQKDKTFKSDIFEDNGNLKILKISRKFTGYNLDFYIQVKSDEINDVFVRLPQHFLHDLLLADLQKRFKKQDRFVRKDMSALYAWINRDGKNILYHGSCSITCFPMFIEVVSSDPGKVAIPLYEKFNEALPKW